jgi:N6-L-threonylcarbamoyladenine synthase
LYKKKEKINSFVLAGGVASNKFIREKFINLCAKKSVQFIVPEQDLCVDNATMIAWAAIERLQINKKGDILDFEPKPRWALEKL